MIGVVILIIAVIVVAVVMGQIAAKKRREELSAWAAAHGLVFSEDKIRGFDTRYPSFSCLKQGSGRYAYNLIRGDWSGRPLQAFDYHYETQSTDSKGNTETHHHYFSAVILDGGMPLKPILIRPENMFDKVASFFGFEDINFESAEFSRRFHVKSPDRKWAYDLLHPRAMEFLLAAPAFSMEFDSRQAIVWRASMLSSLDLEQAVGVIAGLLDRMPKYLVQEQTAPPVLLPPVPGRSEQGSSR